VTDISKDFTQMLSLKNELQLSNFYKKYEDLQESLFDPCMIIDESRPYATTSGRYYIFDDVVIGFISLQKQN